MNLEKVVNRTTSCLIGSICLVTVCGTTSCRKQNEAIVQPPNVDTVSSVSSKALFVDVTKSRGIDFQHEAGGEEYFVPRSIGSGVALVDLDNDGLLDLYCLQNAGPASDVNNVVYRQQPDHTFVDCSAGSGLDFAGYGMGIAAGDVNNDGRPDLLVTEFGGIRLMLNESAQSKIRFVDATIQANLSNPTWGTSASFFDYDRDGWLDLVIANYLDYDPSRRCTDAGGRPDFCGPQSFAPVVARLFHNRGVSAPSTNASVPQFEDVTVDSGFASTTGAGLGVLCADFNDDRWVDVFIANDGVPNTLWINQQDGTFKEKATRLGLAYNALGEAEADMGIAYGDVDGDGRFDLFVAHRATETHTLWSSTKQGIFIDRTQSSGITRTAWRGTGFGTAFGDFDNDGDLDLSVVNGRVLRAGNVNGATEANSFWQPYAQRDQLFLNTGDGVFQDVSDASPDFSSHSAVSRGLACGDVNNDGRLDLVVTSIAGPTRLFMNAAKNSFHWLTVRAIDTSPNRDAYGARVEVHLKNRVLLRDVNPGYSYLSSNDPRVHFGLGENDQYEMLRIQWPDGTTEEFPGGSADHIIQINRGQGKME